MSLREYMATLKDHLFDRKKLANLNYNPNDKDSGYRSGLRFLGLTQSKDTDLIAQEMIYGSQHLKKKITVKIENMQMHFEFL